MEVRRWERRYGRRLLLTDAIVVVGAVFGAQWTRFGVNEAELAIEPLSRGNFALTYSLVSTVLSLGWLIALAIGDTREPKIYGAGSTEYKRVINATLFTFGAYAIIAFLMRAQIGRGYLMIALPAGLFLLLLSRWAWRKRLHRQRLLARNQYRTLIVGEHHKCRHVVKRPGFVGGSRVMEREWSHGPTQEQGTPLFH